MNDIIALVQYMPSLNRGSDVTKIEIPQLGREHEHGAATQAPSQPRTGMQPLRALARRFFGRVMQLRMIGGGNPGAPEESSFPPHRVATLTAKESLTGKAPAAECLRQ
ncbi:MAG TPA: hypothetical protein VLV76_20675 [Candidatus Acidoferrum sp.]|nr:hypothetical protein [Candidatus Acidoferrum sp.]